MDILYKERCTTKNSTRTFGGVSLASFLLGRRKAFYEGYNKIMNVQILHAILSIHSISSKIMLPI